jgi:hypothetical protein
MIFFSYQTESLESTGSIIYSNAVINCNTMLERQEEGERTQRERQMWRHACTQLPSRLTLVSLLLFHDY